MLGSIPLRVCVWVEDHLAWTESNSVGGDIPVTCEKGLRVGFPSVDANKVTDVFAGKARPIAGWLASVGWAMKEQWNREFIAERHDISQELIRVQLASRKVCLPGKLVPVIGCEDSICKANTLQMTHTSNPTRFGFCLGK